jgi:hypothetical protein
LASDSTELRLVIDAAESPTHDPDVYSLTAHGDNEDAVSVQVTLHVIFGRLSELEIWGGEYGPTKLPPVTALTYSRTD